MALNECIHMWAGKMIATAGRVPVPRSLDKDKFGFTPETLEQTQRTSTVYKAFRAFMVAVVKA
ncbi:hypothetical protein B0H17DRAFT_1216256 [Mycena rosella]|uniref:Uncharacterized protein n=1 Tax=Mycena rosella TaxID=1033263 RepID=A0AAD7FXM8_MYCRO|nr:hypothetical protein B0H17DRAFT_1216256 [Mycena rosella]